MTDREPLDEKELRAIENQVARLVVEFGKRAKRGGLMGCTWMLFLGIAAVQMKNGNNAAVWILLAVVSFLVVGVSAKRAAQRAATDFKRIFSASRGDPRRGAAAVSHLWRLAHSPPDRATKNKPARQLLEALGVTHPPPSIIWPHAVVSVETPPPLRVPTAAPATGSLRAGTHVAHPPPPASLPSVRPATSRSSPAPKAGLQPEVQMKPGVLEPTASTTSKPSPPATSSSHAADALVPWRCGSCGLEARVPRAEVNRLCPVCFPQIRLDA